MIISRKKSMLKMSNLCNTLQGGAEGLPKSYDSLTGGSKNPKKVLHHLCTGPKCPGKNIYGHLNHNLR